MKNGLFKGLTLLFTIAAVTVLSTIVMSRKETVAMTNAAQSDMRKITVNGQGSVKVRPDVAYVTLGVQTESADAKEAQAQNTKLMNSVIDSVKALGVAEKDIRTSGYYMYPQYNYNEKVQQLTGYTVTNSITVTMRNIEKVGDIIDSSIAAGANMTNSIQFNISDPTPHYQEALKSALENAKMKGNTIAASLGVKIDLPLEIIEQNNYYAPVSYGNMNMNAQYDVAGGTAIQTGELEVSATIQVIYGY